jgi:hypothetical protein
LAIVLLIGLVEILIEDFEVCRTFKPRTETNGNGKKVGLQLNETKAGDGDRTRDVQLGKTGFD